MKSFITLMAVLIMGVVGTSTAVFLILSGTDAYRTSYDLEQSYQAKSLADACAEKALNSIRESTDYAGNELIPFEKGSCEILPVVNPGTQSPMIKTKATVGNAVRKVQVTVSEVTPQIKIQSWQEVADF